MITARGAPFAYPPSISYYELPPGFSVSTSRPFAVVNTCVQDT
jgi:hypothetical protein